MKKTLVIVSLILAIPPLARAQPSSDPGLEPPPAAQQPVPVVPPSSAPRQQIVGAGQLDSVVRVRDVHVTDDEIAGTVVNLTDDELRDVRLRVRDMFLWTNERRPGNDDFSRAEEFVVKGPIPPRGAMAFTAPRTPLPLRSDGEFRTSVEVTALTRQPMARAAGTGAVPAAPTGTVPPAPDYIR